MASSHGFEKTNQEENKMSRFWKSIFLGLALLLLPLLSWAADYSIDPAHSEVSFKIRHMGISKVNGRFDEFSGEFSFDSEHPENSRVNASISLSSVDTDNPKRDDHLRSPDFFDIEKYPTMSFSGSGVSQASEESFKLTGELTLHGVTKPVLLDVALNGLVTDPWGNERVGFSATTRIDRRDFDLKWTQNLGTGELVVGNTVSISLEIEGVAKK